MLVGKNEQRYVSMPENWNPYQLFTFIIQGVNYNNLLDKLQEVPKDVLDAVLNAKFKGDMVRRFFDKSIEINIVDVLILTDNEPMATEIIKKYQIKPTIPHEYVLAAIESFPSKFCHIITCKNKVDWPLAFDCAYQMKNIHAMRNIMYYMYKNCKLEPIKLFDKYDDLIKYIDVDCLCAIVGSCVEAVDVANVLKIVVNEFKIAIDSGYSADVDLICVIWNVIHLTRICLNNYSTFKSTNHPELVDVFKELNESLEVFKYYGYEDINAKLNE